MNFAKPLFLVMLALSASVSAFGQTDNDESEQRLRDAQLRLEEAAAELAELGTRMAPDALAIAREALVMPRRALLGIQIASSDDDSPVEGVAVQGVTPGGPADEAGMQSGDIVTSIDNLSLASKNAAKANRNLLDALRDVEPGSDVVLALLRDGKKTTATVTTRENDRSVLALRLNGEDFNFDFDRLPAVAGYFSAAERNFSGMELVELTPGLGKYFNAEEGLLVVSGPKDDKLQLVDGDVIVEIGGRKPKSVAHATRILRSYTDGETLELKIMRDKRRRTLNVEIPQ